MTTDANPNLGDLLEELTKLAEEGGASPHFMHVIRSTHRSIRFAPPELHGLHIREKLVPAMMREFGEDPLKLEAGSWQKRFFDRWIAGQQELIPFYDMIKKTMEEP